MIECEEFIIVKQRWAWTIILIACVAILLWGYGNYFFVRDRPRQYDYGALPDAPGQSVYAVSPVPAHPVPPVQLAPLPPASAPATAPSRGVAK